MGKDKVTEEYGSLLFTDAVMQERLPKPTYKELKQVIEEGKKLDLSIANEVAHAMKEWALEKGATHYTHWFQPLTGITAEKHDSFITPQGRRQRPHVSSRARNSSRASRTPPPSPPAACAPPSRPAATPPGTPPARLHQESEDPMHPHGLRLLHRRGAGQEDPAAALHGGPRGPGHACAASSSATTRPSTS